MMMYVERTLKFVIVNKQCYLREQQWEKENSFLRQEKSLEVMKVMKLRKSLEDKEKEVIDLKEEIKHLKEKLRRKEMEEMKEEIPSDF